jgi:1-acyl-sn-glycerol-3-phosphate acyltransferase
MAVCRLKEHVEDPNKLPILIFPEGTCINNTSVMQFKKGSFEVSAFTCLSSSVPNLGDW